MQASSNTAPALGTACWSCVCSRPRRRACAAFSPACWRICAAARPRASGNELAWHRSIGDPDMNLTPREKDKLLVSMAALVARRRLERGVKLNHPEAVALITDFVVEGARDGRSVAELMQAGAQVLAADQVMDGIA